MRPQYLLPEVQVELLRRQFLQLVDPKQLPLPAASTIKAPEIQAQIYKTMFDPECLTFPPPPRYRLRVLKRIWEAIERAVSDPDEDEISNDLTATLAELMAEPSTEQITLARQRHYVTYTLPAPLEVPDGPPRRDATDVQGERQISSFPNNHDQTTTKAQHGTITLLESQDVHAAAGTTGRRTWEAALWLGSYLASAHGRTFVEGKTILELGVGTGFVAVLCARHLGAAFVLATDGSGDVIDDLGSNLYLNDLEPSKKIDTAVLKWGHALVEDMLDGDQERRQYGLVIGSDLVYDHTSVRPLVSTIKQMLDRDRGCRALISVPVRNEATLNLFEDVCRGQSMSLNILEVPNTDPSQQTGFFNRLATPIRIYVIELL